MPLVTFVAASLTAVESLPLNTTQLPVAQRTVKYYAYVVSDGGDCSFFGNAMPMCASAKSVCRMAPGQEAFAMDPSCLAYDPSNMADNPYEIEETASAPWTGCTLTAELHRKMGDPPVCQREFQCQCLQGATGGCICAPADVVDDAHGALTCGGGGTSCPADEYCHYVQAGGQQCGKKPYFL